MKKQRRVFSPEDRLSIIQEGKREGTMPGPRKIVMSDLRGQYNFHQNI